MASLEEVWAREGVPHSRLLSVRALKVIAPDCTPLNEG